MIIEYFKNIELKCFDVFGNEIYKENVYQIHGESEINISNWQKGIYFVIVYSKGFPVGQTKFVMR